MKKWIVVLLFGMLLLLASCAGSETASEPVLSSPPTIASSETTLKKRDLRVSVTQMLADSPMFSQLCERFMQQSGYRVDISQNPDQTAVSVAETGKFDLLIAQKGIEASRFVTAEYGTDITDWIAEPLVLAGPAADPAAVSEAESLSQAMLRIAKTGAKFISCYDDSDLYRAEKAAWKSAGVTIGNGKQWYTAARTPVSLAIQLADQEGAYFLSTREALLTAQPQSIRILYDGAGGARVFYCLIPVSAATFENVNTEGVDAFVQFLRSPETAEWIESYGTDSLGSPIFESIE